MAENSFSKEDRILQTLKFFDEINELLNADFNQALFEEIISKVGEFFKVSKIYYIKCFGINYWEVRHCWSREKQILKSHISGNWENLVALYSFLSTGNAVTDDIADYSQELSKWKSYFGAKNILIIPILTEKKLQGLFVLQDVEKKFFYEDEILILKLIFSRLINLYDLNEKISFLRTTTSELRKEFENFNLIFNLIPALITQKSENLKYENVNENFLKLLGKRKFEVLGKSDFEFFPETIAQELTKADLDTLENKNQSTQIHEIKVDDKKYYFIFHRVVFIEPEIRTKHLLTLAVDITEIFEEKIRSEITSKTKSEFLANMSHELRTPLNSIIGFTELLLQENLSQEQKEILSNIRQSSYSLLELLNDILDLNKIEAGKLELNPVPVLISDLLNEVKNLFKERFESKNLSLEILIDKSVPDAILIDPLRLKQILINLVGNAYKFTERGGVKIKVRNLSATKDVGNTVYLEFAVEDTGIGIPADKLNLIFEAFTQAEKDTAQKFGGTGLGLTISKKFVEMMNGKISVESEVGKGSIFSFVIPVEVVQVEKIEKAKVETEKFLGSTSPYAPLILIIEDNLETARIIERHLKEKEFKLLISQTAKDGISNAKKYHPDLILLDIFLPDKSGWEVLRELKSDVVTKSIPVVICSIQKEINKAFSLGAIDYLEKPINVKQLQSLLIGIKEKFPIGNKIFVVDDDHNTLRRLDQILSKNGYEAECFDDPELALKKLKEKKKPALIILDLMMPKMDGFQVLTEIRKDDDLVSVPVIILTSKKLLEDELKFLEERTSGIFFKESFDENVFLNRLDKILDKIKQAKSVSTVSTIKVEKAVEKPTIPPLHILLVEDNLMNQKFMSHILKRLGSTFDIAIDGKDAIEKVKQNKYDLILMDVQMPVMDGLEATRYIRNELNMKDIPIIALTAHAMKGDREKCLAAGCTGYITKPVDQQKLVSEIMSTIKSTEPEFEEISPYFQGFSREEIIQLRTDYIESMRKEVEELDKKLSPKEFEAFRYFGHNIKGNGVAYGFPEISKFGAQIEEAANNQDYPTLVTAFNEFKNYLSNLKI
ncbi:MAG: response regulator [Ignavibacteria bacterium]|jgi:CheY-like chemotaxis protein|nr:response regulator [Ignavibacteria bacterium]MDH7527646.1 response regulator [Ignavibacteria bacterium]